MASCLLLKALAHASGLPAESQALSTGLRDDADGELQVHPPVHLFLLIINDHLRASAVQSAIAQLDGASWDGRCKRTRRRSHCRRCWTASCGLWNLRAGRWWWTLRAAAECTSPAPSTRCTTATGEPAGCEQLLRMCGLQGAWHARKVIQRSHHTWISFWHFTDSAHNALAQAADGNGLQGSRRAVGLLRDDGGAPGQGAAATGRAAAAPAAFPRQRHAHHHHTGRSSSRVTTDHAG